MTIDELRRKIIEAMCSSDCVDGKTAYENVLNWLDQSEGEIIVDKVYPVVPDCQIEDLACILMRYLGYMTDGTFVEVGAYDGKSWSNTYGLAQIGWHGIYIEPVPEYCERCIGNHKDHKNVVVVNALVSNKAQKMTLRIRPDLATVDEDYHKHIFGANADVKSIVMQSVTLTDILVAERIDQFFELLVIDTEGHDLAVLEGFNIEAYYPKMVIIETHELSDDIVLSKNAIAINRYMNGHGYTKVYTDKINSIFVLLFADGLYRRGQV